MSALDRLDRVQHNTAFIDAIYDCPTLVLEAGGWSYRHAGQIRVPMVAYESTGPWIGPRKGIGHTSETEANAMLAGRVLMGLREAFGEYIPKAGTLGTLYVRQDWTITTYEGQSAMHGRFGAVIRLPSP